MLDPLKASEACAPKPKAFPSLEERNRGLAPPLQKTPLLNAILAFKRDEETPRYHSSWRSTRPLVILCYGRTRPNLLGFSAVLSAARGGAIFPTPYRLTPTADSLPSNAIRIFYPVIAFIYSILLYFRNLVNDLSLDFQGNPCQFLKVYTPSRTRLRACPIECP